MHRQYMVSTQHPRLSKKNAFRATIEVQNYNAQSSVIE